MAVNEMVPVAETRIPTKVPHLTEAESREKGKAARAKVPRSSHAAYEPGPDRPDPVSLLEGQATTRVPELVPIRYGRMLASPFTFYRGAALIMASDLSRTPRSGLSAQICGDAHLSNFGVFGSPERRLVFDCNDFDETNPDPGSGTSSASPPVWWWPPGIAASPRVSRTMPCSDWASCTETPSG